MPKKYEDNPTGARELFAEIAGLSTQLLSLAPRDICALECLANDPFFAKPDSQKVFVLWEARSDIQMLWDGDKLIECIRIDMIHKARLNHRSVIDLFLGPKFVRFPFNPYDTDQGESLSWYTILDEFKVDGWEKKILQLPRWSTASRSCFSLIPKRVETLPGIDEKDIVIPDRKSVSVQAAKSSFYWVNVPEWNDREEGRYFQLQVGADRMYSVKTGVKYVGSTDESGANKHRLETNCFLAMARSKVIEDFAFKDPTFGIQSEVLTITAPCSNEVYNELLHKEVTVAFRDGFQVRDLSCLRANFQYMPCQALPYARNSFDMLQNDQVEEQLDFWRKNFTVPLGRAKARLLLNYGLVHYSANAQNFLLGFEGNRVKQFVARDLGDTSWHDIYIENYFKPQLQGEMGGNKAFRKFAYDTFCKEDKEAHAHTLWKPDGIGYYPPPRIMRLAANSVLTHRFAEMLRDKHMWSNLQVYKLATGMLDGFKEFMQEAFDWKAPLYPHLPDGQDTTELDKKIKSYGVEGKFPTKTEAEHKQKYNAAIDLALTLPEADLFKLAAQVRKRGNSLEIAEKDKFRNGDDDSICTLLNAEELLMCAGLEIRLGTKRGSARKDDINQKLGALLSGSRQWPKVVPDEGNK